MDKHRSNVFIALVLVLLIIAAILAWTTGSKILSGAPVTANDNAKPVSTKVVPSAAVTTAVSAAPSAAPAETSTPEPTATPKPSSTPKPTATPKPEARTLDKGGSISSQTGANINMRVDWHITSANSKELTLDVEVYIVSYAINAGQHNGSIRLYGKEYTFVSDPIRIDDNSKKHETLIYDATVTIPAEAGETVAVPISAKWDFDGVYGGKQIGRITAEAALTVKA